MLPIDLHIHSDFSDGTQSVDQILDISSEKKLTAISIADHDTVGAYLHNDSVAKMKAVQALVIPCVEITIHHKGGLFEMLGYGFDPKLINKDLTHLSAPQFWAYVAQKFVEKLKKFGITDLGLTKADMLKPANVYEKLMDRHPHFLETFDSDFNKGYSFLRRKGFYNPASPLHLDLRDILTDSKKSIEIIKDAGGLAILAHFGEYASNAGNEILQDLGKGMDGVEFFHPANEMAEIKQILANYQRYNPDKVYTGGSDFHGTKGEIGKPHVPDEILDKILKKNPKCFTL